MFTRPTLRSVFGDTGAGERHFSVAWPMSLRRKKATTSRCGSTCTRSRCIWTLVGASLATSIFPSMWVLPLGLDGFHGALPSAPPLPCRLDLVNWSASDVLPGEWVEKQLLNQYWNISGLLVWNYNPALGPKGTLMARITSIRATNLPLTGCFDDVVQGRRPDWAHHFQAKHVWLADSVGSTEPGEAEWPRGSTSAMSLHNLNCSDHGPRPSVMAGWQLHPVKGGYMRFRFECRAMQGGLGECVTKETPLDDSGDGLVAYLERHELMCGQHEAMSQWNLFVRAGLMSFRYQCCRVVIGLGNCLTFYTPPQHYGNGGTWHIRKHNPSCQHDEVMGGWKLLGHEGSMSQTTIMYRCCPVGAETPRKTSILGIVSYGEVRAYQWVPPDEVSECMMNGEVGFEDPRMFTFLGEEWGVSVRRGRRLEIERTTLRLVRAPGCAHQMVIWPMNDPERILPLSFQGAMPMEKNWLPFEAVGRLFVLYSVQPQRVLEVNPRDGSCVMLASEPFEAFPACVSKVFHLSGSVVASGSVMFRGTEYKLASLHTGRNGVPCIRQNMFYLFDAQPPFTPRFVTPLLRFGDGHRASNLEYLTSIVLEGPPRQATHVVLGWGKDDCNSVFKRIALSEFLDRMQGSQVVQI